MQKQIKITYLKKSVKFLKKNQNIITLEQDEVIIESIVEDIDFRGEIYK